MNEIQTENTTPKKSGKYCKKIPQALRPYFIGLVVVLVVCCLCAVYQLTNSSSITITINSMSISKGQNPDGSAFDIYQILSDEVLTAASKKLDGKISAAELKRHLSISDALSAESNKQLKQSILDGEYENVYFPSVYCITYSTISDQIKSEGITQQIASCFTGLTYPSKGRILNAVATSYQEIYEASYLSYDSMFEIDWAKIDAMDYYNRAEALRTETMRILRFLEDKAGKNPTTTSSAKLTYGDLSNDLWQLISVDIENHQAHIVQNNISRSYNTLLRQFCYMEEIHIEEMERKTEEYLILDGAVDMYDSTTTKVVFIPALDQDDSFYMNRTKVGLDYLVESADAARIAADEAQHNAQYYQYLQTCFASAAAPKTTQISHADEVYTNIKAQTIELLESVKTLLAESNQEDNEGIKIGNPKIAANILGVGLSFAKRFVLLTMTAYVLIIVPPFFFKKKAEANAKEV